MSMQSKFFIALVWCIAFGLGASSYGQSVQEGIASYYGNQMQGRKTASGERYDKNDFTCAHKTYPFGTQLRVTRVDNGLFTVVRVNDRGPYGRGRVVDVSGAAARALEMVSLGVVRVRVELADSTQLSLPADTMLIGAQATGAQPYTAAPISDNLFEVAVTRIPAEGFAVQLQSTSSADGLLARIAEVRGLTTAQTMVHVSKQNGSTLYRLLVGAFFTQEAAIQARDALAADGYEGIVISLQNLR